MSFRFDIHIRKQSCRQWLLGLLCLGLAGGGAFSAEKGAVVSEYEVKAALVYNFTKFTEWPSNAFLAADAPTLVGILGDDAFGKLLGDVLAGESVAGHPLQVRRLTGEDALPACQVLFISKSEKERLKTILATVRDLPVLTISKTEGFGQLGGMVNFVVVDKSIRFEINPGAAQHAGIKISSKLLNLPKAIKVETRKE